MDCVFVENGGGEDEALHRLLVAWVRLWFTFTRLEKRYEWGKTATVIAGPKDAGGSRRRVADAQVPQSRTDA